MVVVDSETGKETMFCHIVEIESASLNFEDDFRKFCFKNIYSNKLNYFYNLEMLQDTNEPRSNGCKANSERKKRAVVTNNMPVNLYVSYLIVLDSTVFTKYKNLFGQLSNDLTMQYLRIQYSQLVNAVNIYLKKLKNLVIHSCLKIDLRYSMSLATDPNLRINVRLVNMLIYTVWIFFLYFLESIN